jgi:hypothetical protein
VSLASRAIPKEHDVPEISTPHTQRQFEGTLQSKGATSCKTLARKQKIPIILGRYHRNKKQ